MPKGKILVRENFAFWPVMWIEGSVLLPFVSFTLRRQQADEPPCYYVSGEDAHGRRPGAGGLRPCRASVDRSIDNFLF